MRALLSPLNVHRVSWRRYGEEVDRVIGLELGSVWRRLGAKVEQERRRLDTTLK